MKGAGSGSESALALSPSGPSASSARKLPSYMSRLNNRMDTGFIIDVVLILMLMNGFMVQRNTQKGFHTRREVVDVSPT